MAVHLDNDSSNCKLLETVHPAPAWDRRDRLIAYTPLKVSSIRTQKELGKNVEVRQLELNVMAVAFNEASSRRELTLPGRYRNDRSLRGRDVAAPLAANPS